MNTIKFTTVEMKIGENGFSSITEETLCGKYVVGKKTTWTPDGAKFSTYHYVLVKPIWTGEKLIGGNVTHSHLEIH